MVSDSVLGKLIDAFATNPSTLMLAMVLFGVGFIGYRLAVAFGKNLEQLVVTLNKMSDSLAAIREDTHELKTILSEKH